MTHIDPTYWLNQIKAAATNDHPASRVHNAMRVVWGAVQSVLDDRGLAIPDADEDTGEEAGEKARALLSERGLELPQIATLVDTYRGVVLDSTIEPTEDEWDTFRATCEEALAVLAA